MGRIVLDTVVDAPPETVFDFLADIERLPEYSTLTERVTDLDPTPVGAGTTWREDTPIGPVSTTGTWEVAEFERPSRLVFDGEAWFVSVRVLFQLEEQDGHTALHQVTNYELPSRFGAFGRVLDRGPFRRVLEARQRESLSNFTHAVQAAHNARARFEPGEDAESDGYVVENTVTGERLKFLEEPTAAGGDVLRFEFWARPHIVGPAAHVHPKQTEYFEVLDGVLSARVGKRDLDLEPGESVTVPPGTAHTWWNAGDEELHGYCELRPSMNMRDEFEAFFALGRAGKTDERGLPNVLQIAVILDTYPDTIYRAGVPVPVQKLGIAMLAPIARMLGYKARYPELIGAEATEIA